MTASARSRLDGIIQSGVKPLGSFVSSVDAQTTDILAKAGFDFVIIDREHGPHDNGSALGHIRAAERNGIVPFIRVLENSKTLIQSSLDLGAHGVVVPKVETEEEARNAADASLYGPSGSRGMCPACYSAGYCGPEDWPEHQAASDREILTIPLIETVKAVDNIDAILDVAGIDYVMFGPGDLAADMGIDMTRNPEALRPAWEKVLQAAHSRGKRVMSVGFLGFDGAADLYAGTADLMILLQAARQRVRDMRAGPAR